MFDIRGGAWRARKVKKGSNYAASKCDRGKVLIGRRMSKEPHMKTREGQLALHEKVEGHHKSSRTCVDGYGWMNRTV